MLVAKDLAAAYRYAPIGCGSLAPKLSWAVECSDPTLRDKKQTAYRITAASSLSALIRDEPDLWDTHKVTSTDTFDIPYGGKPAGLVSATAVYWKIMLWNEQDQPGSWSEPAHWLFALLNPTQDWQAAWISSLEKDVTAELAKPSESDSHVPPPVDTTSADTSALEDTPVPVESETASPAEPREPPLLLPAPQHFITSFQIDKLPARATLCCTAKGIYKMYMNGAAVGNDFFSPGWTDYNIRHPYQMYDVTEQLKNGANALGAIVADGWYAGYIGWRHQREHYGSRVSLLAQLIVDYEDGSREVLAATNSNWKCFEGPITCADFLMGETYDARREIAGWSEAGFSFSHWSEVEVTPVGESAIKLQVHPSYPVQAVQEFPALEITLPSPGVHIFNLGQNFAGVVRLKVEGAKSGDTIVLRFGERLQDNGQLYTENLRTARATDTYICKGEPLEVWQPLFTFHGFQYVEVTGYSGTPALGAITGIALSSATPRVGSLQTSDAQTNQLLSNIWWTQRSNFIDLPTDCPQRDERLGWTGDAQVYIRTACFFTDLQAFFHKWLQDLRDAQAGSGQFPMFAPLPEKMMMILGSRYALANDGGPGWADAGVLCPWTLYEMYGDVDILEASFPSMLKFIDFCVGRCDADLTPPEQFHCFGDWLNDNDKTPKEVMFVGMLAASVAAVRDAAAVLGEKEQQGRLSKLLQQVKATFVRLFVEEGGYKITSDTQCAYVIALAYDILDESQQAAALKRLLELLESRGWHLSTGFIATRLLMLVLDKFARNEVAYRLLHNITYPSWGFSIKHGATSIWERWNGWTPEKGFEDPMMNSFAHYSFGAVGQWVMEVVGGIRPTSPAFSFVDIAPVPGGILTWAECSYNSRSGLITVRWELKNASRLEIVVTIPPGVRANINVPCANLVEVETDEDVKSRMKANTKGGHQVEVGSGRYVFQMPYSLPQST